MPANSYLHKKRRKQIKTKKEIDLLCYFGSVFMPLTALPQIHLLYTSKNAGGLSLAMWILYGLGVIPFLLFGVMHKEKQLVILNLLWLVVDITMITGILIYKS